MSLNIEKDYAPLRDAAAQMNLAYSTLHQYCQAGKIDGAIFLHGTRWYVSNKTIQLWNEGEICVKGAFGKGD